MRIGVALDAGLLEKFDDLIHRRGYVNRSEAFRDLIRNELVEEAWKAILPVVEETGADGIELNFGCPHGMSERGMGSAVGQVPEYIEMVVRWCKANTRMPVITKLTPNITDIRRPARAAHAGGTDAVSLINTINSITSVNLDTFSPEPSIDDQSGWFAGGLSVNWKVSAAELHNAVKGVIANRYTSWQPADFPMITNATYESQDGERIAKDIELPFTSSPSAAQRLAKIDLERARQQITVETVLNLRGYRFVTPDVVGITRSLYGW